VRPGAAGKRHWNSHGCLQEVITLAQTPLVDLIQQVLEQEVEDEILNVQAALQTTAITQSDHDIAKAKLELYQTNILLNLERRGQCSSLAPYNFAGYPTTGAVGSVIPTDNVYSSSIGGGAALVDVTLDPPVGTALTYNNILPAGVTSCDAACVCTKLVDAAETARSTRFESMQNSLVARLDRNSGRLGVQKSRKLELVKAIVETELELYDFIIDLSKGLEPLSDPENALLDDVIGVYVNGPLAYGVDGQPNIADSMLKRAPIMELNFTANPNDIGTLVERCQVCGRSTGFFGQNEYVTGCASVSAHMRDVHAEMLQIGAAPVNALVRQRAPSSQLKCFTGKAHRDSVNPERSQSIASSGTCDEASDRKRQQHSCCQLHDCSLGWREQQIQLLQPAVSCPCV
jgi:hypothetical protein